MASDKDIAKTEEYSDSEDEADEAGERRHMNSHKDDEPSAKRPKITVKAEDEEDAKNKAEMKLLSAATSKSASPKPSSPRVTEAKSPEKLANAEQASDPNTDK